MTQSVEPLSEFDNSEGSVPYRSYSCKLVA